jgi:hypothetical protein
MQDIEKGYMQKHRRDESFQTKADGMVTGHHAFCLMTPTTFTSLNATKAIFHL